MSADDPSKTESVSVHALAFGGDGVGRLANGKAVFVPGTTAGETVRIRVHEEKRSHAFAMLLAVESPAPERVTPPCAVADRCGGCAWQHLGVEAQRAWKRRLLEGELVRRGLAGEGDVLAQVTAGESFGHRTRTRLHLRDGVFGTVRRRSHETIPLEACPILAPELERFALELGAEARARSATNADMELYVDRNGRRGLFVQSQEDGSSGLEAWRRLAEALDVHALRVQGARAASSSALGDMGRAFLEEDSAGRTLRFEPGAFVQTSRGINALLVREALELVDHPERFAELYAGVGNFSVHLSGRCARGSIAEGSPRALASLCFNVGVTEPGAPGGPAAGGARDGVEVFCERDAHSGRRLARAPRLDLLFVDPPRAGIKALYPLFKQKPPRTVLMVSCHPMAALRDLEWLAREGGYRLERLVPVDLFPQTAHVEIVARLTRDG